jgi:hypothetical protein
VIGLGGISPLLVLPGALLLFGIGFASGIWLQRPNLPLVFTQIGSQTAPEAFTSWTVVVQEQQAAVDLPCVAMITTKDLALHDGVHYTSESYQTIGARFADVYVELTNAQVCE